MGNPIPLVVSTDGASGDAPHGSIPIALYGAGGGSGGGDVTSVAGKTGDVVLDIADIGDLEGELESLELSVSPAGLNVWGLAPTVFTRSGDPIPSLPGGGLPDYGIVIEEA